MIFCGMSLISKLLRVKSRADFCMTVKTAPHVHGTITAGMPNVFIENTSTARHNPFRTHTKSALMTLFIISLISNWVVPENIHTTTTAASILFTPLAFRNSKMVQGAWPKEFQFCLPPPLLEFHIFYFFYL